MNLKAIPWLKQRFRVPVGLSDHSRHPTSAPVAAVALGATVIEKHFTIDNRLPGPDHSFAVEPAELKELVIAVRQAQEMLGSPMKIVDEAENELRAFCCRGIQAIKDIPEGDVLSEGDNIAILRPGKRIKGVHARFLSEIEGQRAKRHISIGEGIQRGDYA
jgi:N-acetylneuraminate synthase